MKIHSIQFSPGNAKKCGRKNENRNANLNCNSPSLASKKGEKWNSEKAESEAG